MIFETADVYVDFAQQHDVDDLVGVYNSQPAFLRQHLSCTAVTSEWFRDEMHATKDTGFWSCKVVAKATGQVIGLMDVRIDVETYLSLLVVHQAYTSQGVGQQVYRGLESYAQGHQSHAIRIDVLKGYDDRVWDFWIRNGFQVVEDLILEWRGVQLPAVTMKKVL